MQKILTVKNLKKIYPFKKKTINAINSVSFDIYENETFAIVGESGCGKTSIANILSNLLKPSSGLVEFATSFSNESSKNISMIFQNPYLSLNPKMKIENIIIEPLKIHTNLKKKDLKKAFLDILKKVKLPASIAKKKPYELSGGQRQRVAIARAIILNPKFIILDEPLSSLDILIGLDILNLLKDIKTKFNLSYLFISHDLSAVKLIADRVAVMYLGSFLEISTNQALFSNPLHPYTISLLDSSFSFHNIAQKIILKDEKPSMIDIPKGCTFSNRCPFAKKICFEKRPQLFKNKKDHFVACHFATKLSSLGRSKTTSSVL